MKSFFNFYLYYNEYFMKKYFFGNNFSPLWNGTISLGWQLLIYGTTKRPIVMVFLKPLSYSSVIRDQMLRKPFCSWLRANKDSIYVLDYYTNTCNPKEVFRSCNVSVLAWGY